MENGGDPYHAEGTGAQQRNDHGGDGIADAADRTDDHIHQAAQDVGQEHDGDTHHTGGYHRVAVGVDVQQLRTEEIAQQAAHHCHGGRAGGGAQSNGLQPLQIARAVVLAGKGHIRLTKGVAGHIDEALDIAGGGVAGNDRLAEAVDGRLNDDIGQGEGHALNTGGNADLQNLPQPGQGNAQLPQLKADVALLMHQAAHHQKGGQALADHRGDGHARHVHLEHDHQQKTEPDRLPLILHRGFPVVPHSVLQ